MNLTIKELSVYTPAKDFELSKRFYAALGLLGGAMLLAAVNLLPDLDPLPTTVLPLEKFAEGLEAYTSGDALKVVFTP